MIAWRSFVSVSLLGRLASMIAARFGMRWRETLLPPGQAGRRAFQTNRLGCSGQSSLHRPGVGGGLKPSNFKLQTSNFKLQKSPSIRACLGGGHNWQLPMRYNACKSSPSGSSGRKQRFASGPIVTLFPYLNHEDPAPLSSREYKRRVSAQLVLECFRQRISSVS